MAHILPIFLAFIVNCYEIYIFRNLFNVSCAPLSIATARYIFSIGNFFLILQLKLYPKTFRRVHWLSRSFVEFVIAVYILEALLCEFWFPLEYFSHHALCTLIQFLKKEQPRSGILCSIWCRIICMLSERNIPHAISLFLSMLITGTIIHGTRIFNLSILFNDGFACFVVHLKHQVCKGFSKILASLFHIKKCEIKCTTKGGGVAALSTCGSKEFIN